MGPRCGSYLCLLIFLAIILEYGKVSGQLLPPFGPNSGARSKKTFEHGVVTCGDTFCDAEKCMKTEEYGKVTYSCNE
ncbi:hypothetical protein ANCCAN_17248 [Ancylostoma caninum]|uniref:Uncharacterized protein n=1 Tax=Ancylostoma caninum TaxID=29170 RepID=A0A368FZH1_ANCCA|nr:hypothetical protein ANCCAN_17248 [Ancylostoma caninum]